jgi:YD repeat-containing protein
LLVALIFLAGFTGSVWAQQPRIHYLYDDLGRLVGVVDQDGNAATYTYDAVGNILAIGRHNVADAPGPVAITLVSPDKGRVGTAVSIFGRGFSPDPAQNTVSFSGAIAAVATATATSLTTSLPPGALTGQITVTTPLGTATSPEPFTVLGVVTVTPPSAVLFPTQTQEFTASVSGVSTPTVTWSVGGVAGGNPTVGTISATGLYTAPATVPSPPTLTVTATDTNDPTLSDSATVVIVAPPDQIRSQPVSVGIAPPTTVAVNNLVAPSVSVAFVPTTITVNSLVAPAVSVAVAAPVTVSPLLAPLVSVGAAPP